MDINDSLAKEFALQLKEVRDNTPEIWEADDQIYYKILTKVIDKFNGIRVVSPGLE